MPKTPKWNEVRCPKCREPMAPGASRCPHCQTDFPTDEVAKRVKDQRNGLGFGCLVLLGVVLSLGWCASHSEVPDEPGPTARADAAGFYKDFLKAVRSCDDAGKALSSALEDGGAVAAYQAADIAENTCLMASPAIERSAVPTSVGRKHFDTLVKTVDDCKTAYNAKWVGAKSIKKALDGDTSVSLQAELQSNAQMISAGTIQCTAGLVGVAMDLGASKADLGIND